MLDQYDETLPGYYRLRVDKGLATVAYRETYIDASVYKHRIVGGKRTSIQYHTRFRLDEASKAAKWAIDALNGD